MIHKTIGEVVTLETMRRSDIPVNDRIYSIGELREIITPIARELGIKEVYLFGSYARGEATEDSDVDILIGPEPINAFFGLGKLYYLLNEALGKYLDIVSVDGNEEFVEKIRPELVKIYSE